MKANELMVGDYLMHNGFPYRVIQVDGIVRDGWMIENGEEDCGEPIPITPEILEKNGFETQPNIGYIIDDWDGTKIIYDSWNHNLRIIKNYKVCLDIETFDDISVHELQHALRLCGIEKEIEL